MAFPKEIRNSAEPPAEVTRILRATKLPAAEIKGWYDIPAFDPPTKKIPFRKINKNGQIDAQELINPLSGSPLLNQSLGIMDVLNGCSHQCDTCCADSPWPSKMFSFDSLERLFSNPNFIRILQPYFFRFGWTSSIASHPQGAEIAQMVLDKTAILDQKAQEERGNYLIQVWTNYRPYDEEQIDKLVTLAKKNPKRVDLMISLPFNKTDKVNDMFDNYEKSRQLHRSWTVETAYESITIQDVRHPSLSSWYGGGRLHQYGRILSDEANGGRIPKKLIVYGDHVFYFKYRGLAQIYLNPDALWLDISSTTHESHTANVYTPITPDNLEALSHIPYNPDYPPPPNWQGGTGKLKSNLSASLLRLYKRLTSKPKPNNVVR